jgi:hypothetical protein
LETEDNPEPKPESFFCHEPRSIAGLSGFDADEEAAG